MKKGFKFYSHYLGSDCRVTSYLTDSQWWFYSYKHMKTMKAGTRLSYFKGQEDEKQRTIEKDRYIGQLEEELSYYINESAKTVE